MVNNTYQYYAGNMVYNNDKLLDYLLFDEGLVTKSSAAYTYEYHLKDHLGNTRVAFKPNGSGGTDTTQVADYCPFGSSFLPVYNAAGTNNKYLYNGKEKQDDVLSGTALDWYDYGARFYDPVGKLGWLSVDPLAEMDYSGSPYSYVSNAPINLIDPDGMFSADFKDENDNKTTLIRNLPTRIESTHTDENGNVLDVYDDGDLGVYVHPNGTTTADVNKKHSSSNTSAGGTKKGETYYWDEFRKGDRILLKKVK